MGRHKTVFGRCRLCGEMKDLSFEHIPPRSSFNKNTVYYISSFKESLESDDFLNPKIKGKTKQGGTGNNSLCIDCNNFLGRTYVDSYIGWVQVGIDRIKIYTDSPISFIIEDFEPLKVLKQIFSMFISMDDEDCYDRHKDLCDYVRDPNSNKLPEKYKLLTYLNDVGNTFYIPPLCYGNFNTGSFVLCSELTFSPFGYVFTIDNNFPIDKLTDITSFNKYKLDDKVSIIFQNLYKFPKHLPIPLDYRTVEEIEFQKTQNKL
jgi:hypothetical protein